MNFRISKQWSYTLFGLIFLQFHHATAEIERYGDSSHIPETQDGNSLQQDSSLDEMSVPIRCVTYNIMETEEIDGKPTFKSGVVGAAFDDSWLKGKLIPGAKIRSCPKYCFTYWKSDPKNKSVTIISKQGCWDQGKVCHKGKCLSNNAPRLNHHFCCCSGDGCNANFKDNYRPEEHTTTATLTSPLTDASLSSLSLLPDPLPDPSYRKNTIIIALVSVISVSLVVILGYLSYRMCITPKSTSSIRSESSGARMDQASPTPLSGLDPDLEKLVVKDVLVSGRYSEIRRGTLGDKEVAIKIYTHQYQQYYNNERDAYSLPFMAHENLVKFYGAREQAATATTPHQYQIVLDYLPLGSLTSYLKHNSITWTHLCSMSQDIARGLVHLHTDRQDGDLFKPALAHRDLNTRNILVTSGLRCVITDLGFTTAMMGSTLIRNGMAEHAEDASIADVGTLRYMAPEVFEGAVNLRDCEASLKQIDIYSLSLVIWELASRCVDLYQGTPLPEYQLPFYAETGTHLSFEEMHDLVVMHRTRPKFPDVWKDSNPAVRFLKETIEDCWDSDSEARLTALCVQERITDMAALWTQGARQRRVSLTLNATKNPQEGSQTSPIAFVPNGVAYLPEYGDSNPVTNSNCCMDDKEIQSQGVDLNAPFDASAGTFIESESTLERDGSIECSVTSPLISSSARRHSANRDPRAKRVKSWLQDQSVSQSTVDTYIPSTPSVEGSSEPSRMAAGEQFEPSLTLSGASHGLKANNESVDHIRPVITHANQGRNPTTERNTHKQSEEELMVSGNRLICPADPLLLTKRTAARDTNAGNNSYAIQRGPHGYSNNYEGPDTGWDSNSLVQHDTLGHQHLYRNAPIPYLQNQVCSDFNTSTGRLKLANVNGDVGGTYICPPPNSDGRENIDAANASPPNKKSLKQKLGRLIKPKNIGLKFAHILFRSKMSQNHSSYSPTTLQDLESQTNVNTATNVNVPCPWQRSGLPPNEISNQYVNEGLESSPTHRCGSTNLVAQTAQTKPVMEVNLVNGIPVTNLLPPSETGVTPPNDTGSLHTPKARLSSTNVMRMGILAPSDHSRIQSSSLFSNVNQSDDGDANGRRKPTDVELVSMSCVQDSMVTSAASSKETDSTSIGFEDTNQPSAIAKHFSLTDSAATNAENYSNLLDLEKGGCNNNFEHSGESAVKVNNFEHLSGDNENVLGESGHVTTQQQLPLSGQSVKAHHSSANILRQSILVDTDTPCNSSQLSGSRRSLEQISADMDGHCVSDTDRDNLSEQICPLLKANIDNPSGYQTQTEFHRSCNEGETGDRNVKDPSLSPYSRPKSLNLKGHSYSTNKKRVKEKSVKAARPTSDSHRLKVDLDLHTAQPAARNDSLGRRPPLLRKSFSCCSSSQGIDGVFPVDSNDNRIDGHRSRPSKSQQMKSASASKDNQTNAAREKIRRRIKTPVSFKNGRLSLYDDRLMSQSLDDQNFQVIGFDYNDDLLMTRSYQPDCASTSMTANQTDLISYNDRNGDVCKRNIGCQQLSHCG